MVVRPSVPAGVMRTLRRRGPCWIQPRANRLVIAGIGMWREARRRRRVTGEFPLLLGE